MKTQFLRHFSSLLLLTILFMGAVVSEGQVIFPSGSTWKYLDNGTDQGTAWKEIAFDDAAWASGAGQLGFGDGDESTIVSYGPDDQNKYTTTYFRKSFFIADLNLIEYVKMTLNRDDGAVIYINGTEALRSNMPAGTVTYQTFSSANNEAIETHLIPKTFFVQGNNVIAVSIHQTNFTSSDLSFDMALEDPERLVIASNTRWKYLDNGTDQDVAWRAASFDDAAWASGLAPLGYVMTGVTTAVSFGPSSSNKYRTTYFRKKVNIASSDLTGIDSMKVNLRLDDGGIVYLNGVEILRKNMAAGAVTYTTFANVSVGSAPDAVTINLPASLLQTGDNTFAVEIHQSSASSSDLFFDLAIDLIKPDAVLVPDLSAWKYSDNSQSAPAGWTGLSFDDATWSAGNAALGYGNGNEATTLSYGSNPANKFITSYFRKVFAVSTVTGYANLQLLLQRDDAAVIYINGSEVYRNNIISGSISNSTPALTAIEGTDEQSWITINLPASLLVAGNNVVAAEIHKFNATESDLRFDMKISLQQDARTQTAATLLVTCDPTASDKIGCFTSVKPAAQTPGFIIPTTHTFQLIAKQGQTGLYSNSTRSMPSNHDFTGYIPRNGNSKEGTVSVNHENDPGDVSLLSVHLDEETMTWKLDSARLVDFAPLVRTTRNCSGGVTPWGTVVTSEETYTTGDVNGDGYHDRGWQVEIDPEFGKIVDYDGNGTPDKIWAMGRMNHENFAVSADSAIAYQAEDGGTSGVYKYVMTNKGQLQDGTLWVLKRDNSTSTTGTWVQVPNSTQAERNTVSAVITSLGGTNWNGPEDVEFGPDGKMYFTSKGTGTIWRFKDDGNTVSEIEAWVTNRNYPIKHSEGTVNESFGTGIDNLTFDGEGNLWALQDGGRGHLWVIRPDHTQALPKVELFAVTPTGSESTGLTFTPDYKYGFVSIQHPAGTTDLVDAAGNTVRFNAGATLVFARKEYLGAAAVKPVFDLGTNPAACETYTLVANTNEDVLNIWENNTTDTALTVTTSGWYKAVAYANNGRSYEDSVYVTINPNPFIALGTLVNACDEPVTLSAGDNAYTYAWSDNTTDASITVSESGEYSVVKTNPVTLCTSKDTVEVAIHPLPVLELGEDTSTCNEPVTLSAGDNTYAYAWNNNASSSDITVSAPGSYSVVKTDLTTQCVSKDTIEVAIHPLLSVDLGDDVQLCASCPLTLDAGAGFSTYLWHTSASTRTLEVTDAGTYSVTVTDVNGCEATSSVVITREVITSLEDMLAQQNGFVVLQNSQDRQVNIVAELNASSQVQLLLYDVKGNVIGEVANGPYAAGRQVWNLNEKHTQLANGIYIIKMQAGAKSEARRFVIY